MSVANCSATACDLTGRPAMCPIPTSDQPIGGVIFGALVAFAAGAFVALSMAMQRRALTYPDFHVPFLMGIKLTRPRYWTVGFLFYVGANCLTAVATVNAPLSITQTCFTLLLAWNCVFANRILGEEITPPRSVGAATIILGAMISVGGAPFKAKNKFTVWEIHELVRDVGGILFVISVLGLCASTAGAVWWFEKRYTLSPKEEEERRFRQRMLGVVIWLEGRDSLANQQTPAVLRWKERWGWQSCRAKG